MTSGTDEPRGPNEDREWKLSCYATIVSDPEITDMAWDYACDMVPKGEPPLTNSDISATRTYLRRCLLNMPFAELRVLAEDAAAGLWARGACGARRTHSSTCCAQQSTALSRNLWNPDIGPKLFPHFNWNRQICLKFPH